MAIVGNPLTAVWLYDDTASAYVDNTVEAQTEGGTAFSSLGDTSDKHYFGFSRRIDALMWVLGTAGSYGALTWEYGASITSWIRFIPTHDGELENTPEYMRWDLRGSALESDWASFALTTDLPHASVSSVPDGTARFWIRVSAVAVTTVATFNSVLCRPYVTYATVLDVQRQLQIGTAFSASTTPALSTVEDFIRGAEDRMIYQMGLSWRVEFEEGELLRFNQFGMKLRNDDVITMYELAVWDGSSFQAKNEGRDQDYHIDLHNGFLYIATIFLDATPPSMRRSYTARRDFGAFARPVRVHYSYGKDIRKDRFSVQVGRIATKQACIDIVTDMDFSPLLPLGISAVDLQTKVDNWTREVEDFIETYAK
ncbi:hypothetical protein LCGC14_2473170, partial [marine sediment metagenome]